MGYKRLSFLAVIALAVYLALFSGDQFDPKSVRDQRVLVTGASSGIGEQLAYQYASLGARLVITARRADLLLKISKTCERLGAQQVSFVAADMADPGNRSKIIEHVEKHLGGLDHLVLNHAILLQGWWLGSDENITLLERMYRVNFLSYVDLTSKALPMLVASRGRIGVVSSLFGEVGSVRVAAYSSCKFALQGFFTSLRQEQRHKNTGVSISLVMLGPVASDTMLNLVSEAVSHMPSGFMATPSASARAILESVSQRRYKTYFDWKAKVLIMIHRFFPRYGEEAFADALLEDDSKWLVRVILFLWRNYYK